MCSIIKIRHVSDNRWRCLVFFYHDCIVFLGKIKLVSKLLHVDIVRSALTQFCWAISMSPMYSLAFLLNHKGDEKNCF